MWQMNEAMKIDKLNKMNIRIGKEANKLGKNKRERKK